MNSVACFGGSSVKEKSAESSTTNRNMKRAALLGTSAVGVLGIIAGVGALILTSSGAISVSARPQDGAVTTYLLHNTFKNSVANKASSVDRAAAEPFPGQELLGAQHYQQVCSSCHGLPGQGQSPLALSMRPSPQYLPAVVNQFTDEELFVIIRDGVRFSAMPSWPSDRGFEEIWPLVRFLRKLPDMSEADYRAMVEAPVQGGAPLPRIAWGEQGPQQKLVLHPKPQTPEEFNYSAPATGWHPDAFNNRPLESCVACHGTDGTSAVVRGNAPNLTMLTKQDIARHLRDYATGRRSSGYMAMAASALSGSQIEAISDYYAKAGYRPSNVPIVANAQAIARGQSLAIGGSADNAVPACAACHGSPARRNVTGAPDIIGQNEGFLRTRLFGFSNPQAAWQGPGVWHPMAYIANGIAKQDYGGLAGYFASQRAGTVLTPATFGGTATDPARVRIDQKSLPQFVGEVCTTCHGKDLTGSKEGDVPNLTLLSESYLAQQLARFRLNYRQGGQMSSLAERLSNQQIVGISRYLASMPAAPSRAAGKPVKSTVSPAAAAQLAAQGSRARNLPACLSCHGSSAVRTVELIPALNGQNPAYLAARLEGWRSARGLSLQQRGASPMVAIAGKLTSEEVRALADYFASQKIISKN